MKLAELTNPFFRLIPKEEWSESNSYIISGSRLIYNGVRVSSTVEPFISGVDAIVSYKDLRSISILDSPTAARADSKLTLWDDKTTWTIFAPSPTDTPKPVVPPDSVTLTPIPRLLTRARSLFAMKIGDMSTDAFTYNDRTYVAAISQHIALSIASDENLGINMNLSKNGEVFDALVALSAKIGFDNNMLYAKATLKDTHTITLAMKLTKASQIHAAQQMIENVHSGALETGVIVPCEVQYDDLRELIGIVGQMESPTEMVLEVGAGTLKVTVNEMFGKSFTRAMSAKTSSNKITARIGVLSTRVLGFLLDASGQKAKDLSILFNIMPGTRFTVIRPVANNTVMQDVAVLLKAKI